jgi:predicted aspartyl protease
MGRAYHRGERHGWIDRVDLGGIAIENAPVTIIAKGTELVGIDIIQQLGAWRVSKDALVVYGGNDARPTCSQPMLVASSRDGSWLRLQQSIMVEGHPQTAMIDTGAAMYLSGNAAVKNQYDDSPSALVLASDVGSQKVEVGMRVATRNVVIAGQPIKMLFAIFTNDHQPWGYVLGNLALQDMDFYVDFDNRHSCLLLHDKLH